MFIFGESHDKPSVHISAGGMVNFPCQAFLATLRKAKYLDRANAKQGMTK